MRILFILFVILFSLLYKPELTHGQTLSTITCTSEDPNVPNLEYIKASGTSLEIKWKEIETFVLAAKTSKLGSNVKWNTGKYLLSINLKKSSFGDYYNGTLSFKGEPETQALDGMTYASMICILAE